MKTSARLTIVSRTVQASLLAIAVCFSIGATDASSRSYDLSHRMMCTCGCAQILGECNHVGCTSSTQQLSEIRSGIAGGLTDKQILDASVAKYGAVVLAAPTTKGFDLVAWIAPFAVLAAATLGTFLLVRRWTISRPATAPADFAALDPAERDRLEQIRRETGAGGL